MSDDASGGSGGQRQHERVEANLPGKVFFAGRDHAVTLTDISLGGAGIETETRLPVGSLVDLDIGTAGRFPVVVARSPETGAYGLRFAVAGTEMQQLQDALTKAFPALAG
ncbi:MAG: PilZ domain-containing protein [Alphaproteobacteria bacterium]|jgi:hypothetical protein|nr:PilZ domain-containing protein [Alphaproteobacteria bacterium]